MTKAENWDYLANLTASGKNVMVPTKDGGTKSVGTIEDTPFKTGVTAANGQITWSEVPLGLYYVEEGNYSGTGQITQKAEPFFVSMPYRTPTELELQRLCVPEELFRHYRQAC